MDEEKKKKRKYELGYHFEGRDNSFRLIYLPPVCSSRVCAFLNEEGHRSQGSDEGGVA